jgi:hypothetical protein
MFNLHFQFCSTVFVGLKKDGDGQDIGAIVGEAKLPTCSLEWLTHANELWAKTKVEYQQVDNCFQQAWGFVQKARIVTLEEREYGFLLSKHHDLDLGIMSTNVQLEGVEK